MPQQPASRSTTVAPGMLASSDLGRRQQSHRLLMTMAVQQNLGGPGLERQRRRRPSGRSPRTARTPPRRPPPSFAPRREAATAHPRAWPTGSSARRTRSSGRRRRAGSSASAFRSASVRASPSSPFEICGRPQQLVRREPGAHAGGAKHIEHGHADLGLVVVREGVVEDDGVAPVRRRSREGAMLRQRPRRERGKRAAAIDAEPLLGRDLRRRAVHHPVGQRREAASPLRQRSRVPEHARVQRHAVPRPVVGEKLALESRHVDADRDIRPCTRGIRGRDRARRRRRRRQDPLRRCGPAIARRRTFARPRVESASSCVDHVRRTHRAVELLAAGAEAAAHVDGAAQAAVLRVVEKRHRRAASCTRRRSAGSPSAEARRRSCPD